ncbi:hypothetical protein D7Z26_25360 [Cohnella endophytica]|uniref:Uncharacterized protein n=1 Tax=Cohnella endophytica TaxID=2419778 RepID=A0A494X5C2_9BACL|nr:hypothetical protein [Cohnella endophytica]RKP45878.1 hypothetical protein D7Z26_25360 [Cohnella endophytica]
MSFEKSHAEFIQQHLERRSGERRGRLERGHAHGEKVFLQNIWWAMYGNFDGLHPEYEIVDWRGKSYFADFMLKIGYLKFIMEIKGFNNHIKEMDRQSFCNDTNRELYLQGLGYRLYSFAYDNIANHPDQCISLLRMNLSLYHPSPSPVSRVLLIEREVIRFALSLSRNIRPIDVERYFELNHRTSVQWLSRLVDKGWLRPVRPHPNSKVLECELVGEKMHFF